MVYLAETKAGLQDLIRRLEVGLACSGLALNTRKSATLDVDTVPRDRQIVVNPHTSSGTLPVMTATSFYKYLGVETGTSGTRVTCIKKLEQKLTNLRRAPLKPQQRLWILKTYLIPGVYHQLVLTRVTKQTLEGLDRIIRSERPG